jgi:hypothetical protein
MNVAECILNAIATQGEDVFVRKEFSALGSSAQTGRALRKLINDGMLIRLGVGVYARTKTSVLSGQPIPAKPLEVLAVQALEKLGVRIAESRLVAAYNSGRTSQIQAGVVLNTGRRRIKRKLGFNGKFVEYERDRAWGGFRRVVMTPDLQALVDSIDALLSRLAEDHSSTFLDVAQGVVGTSGERRAENTSAGASRRRHRAGAENSSGPF